MPKSTAGRRSAGRNELQLRRIRDVKRELELLGERQAVGAERDLERRSRESMIGGEREEDNLAAGAHPRRDVKAARVLLIRDGNRKIQHRDRSTWPCGQAESVTA